MCSTTVRGPTIVYLNFTTTGSDRNRRRPSVSTGNRFICARPGQIIAADRHSIIPYVRIRARGRGGGGGGAGQGVPARSRAAATIYFTTVLAVITVLLRSATTIITIIVIPRSSALLPSTRPTTAVDSFVFRFYSVRLLRAPTGLAIILRDGATGIILTTRSRFRVTTRVITCT